VPRKWTTEQKQAQAEAMREYWKQNPHPRKGFTASFDTLELQREMQELARHDLKAYCKRCGDPLYSQTSARIGYGPDCLQRSIDEGLLTYDPYTQVVTHTDAPTS
jgi:pantothenate kinase